MVLKTCKVFHTKFLINKRVARADFGTPTIIKCKGVIPIRKMKHFDRLSYAPTSAGRTEKYIFANISMQRPWMPM